MFTAVVAVVNDAAGIGVTFNYHITSTNLLLHKIISLVTFFNSIRIYVAVQKVKMYLATLTLSRILTCRMHCPFPK
jgi:hypothetical protein